MRDVDLTRGDIVRLALRGIVALLVVALFFLPFGMMTSILWVGGFFVFASSLVRLVRELFGKRVLARIVVALVGVVLFPLACANLGRAMNAARAGVRELGATAQADCVRNGRCPSVTALCRDGGDDRCGTGGSAGIRYPLHYRVADDGKSFSAWTAPNLDEKFEVRGGFGVPLVESLWLDGDDVYARPRVN